MNERQPELKLLSSDFVYVYPINEHENLKDTLLDQINRASGVTKNDHIGKWDCAVNTEHFRCNGSLVDYSRFKVVAERAVLALLTSLAPDRFPKAIGISDVWYNQYDAGGFQEVHMHNKPELTAGVVSGVYLVQQNEPNPLRFYRPHAAFNMLENVQYAPLNAVEGDIVMFPSHLPHYVIPCKQQRTTIAFNVAMDFSGQ